MARQRRRIVVAGVADRFFGGLAAVGGLVPLASPRLHGVERRRDLAYGPAPRQHLDLYRPVGATEPLPTVFYVHGGGFRSLSKDTHWLMGLAFARAGFAVLNVDYRLAPAAPYPAPLSDVARAWTWVLDHADRLGVDPTRLLVAGESAGANLAAALTLSLCFRPDQHDLDGRDDDGSVAAAWGREVLPRGALPACGIFEVRDSERFGRELGARWWEADIIADVEDCYFDGGAPRQARNLADPLSLLESALSPDRPLPPFFLPVGGADPLRHDHTRMAAALRQRGVPHEAPEYPGETHAFHAMLWRRAARRCWREMLAWSADRVA